MPTTSSPNPGVWLLQAPQDGPLWGAGTYMASRAQNSQPQWDANCLVKPLIGGYAAMSDIRNSIEDAISEAILSGNRFGECGHVYISDWRLNALRDLSDGSPELDGKLVNGWSTGPWSSGQTVVKDQTAIGLILRMMFVGIKVRVLLWLPNAVEKSQVGSHFLEHVYVFDTVRNYNSYLSQQYSVKDIGVVMLDTRLNGTCSSHHHNMIVIRGAAKTNVAYCGGVDLAYTRRDAPAAFTSPPSDPSILAGDWQSGTGIPNPAPASLPNGFLVASSSASAASAPRQADDLNVVYGAASQHWHDQHLRLEGRIVETLEMQFAERWTDRLPNKHIIGIKTEKVPARLNSVFVDPVALTSTSPLSIAPLPLAPPVPNARPGTSLVQMWRTIPVRQRTPDGSQADIFPIGEFTNLAGIAKATKAAQNLIWIFDQYFWSVPLARLLRNQLTTNPLLYLIIILPPYADSNQGAQHWARDVAIATLYDCLPIQLPVATTDDIPSRIGIFNLWHTVEQRGIYCHAKVQMYDSTLLVCGSCNLNQRSLLNDSELDCAVLDPAVVIAHQRALWTLLFPGKPVPQVLDLNGDGVNSPGSGKALFTAFISAVSSSGSGSFLQPDIQTPMGINWPYPSGWVRRKSSHGSYDALQNLPVRFLDPTSLLLEMNHPLDEISQMLERAPESRK